MTERMKGDIIIFDSGDFVCCKNAKCAMLCNNGFYLGNWER